MEVSNNGKEEGQKDGQEDDQEKETLELSSRTQEKERGIIFALFSCTQSGPLLFGNDDNPVPTVLVQESQALVHPGVESGRGVFGDLARHVLAIAKPAQVHDALANPKDFTAVLASQSRAH
jgi:hypothetical protein